MSGVQSPPTPLIAAPRPPPPPPPPRPPRPPPGAPVCATTPAPRPPLPRPPRPAPAFACGFIAADPAAPAAPTTPTTVAPKGEPGRRENAKRFPSADQLGAASRSTPGKGNVTDRVLTSYKPM